MIKNTKLRHFIFVCAIGLVYVIPRPAMAKLKVFACLPEWAALSKEIGAAQVDVYSATSVFQDPHYVRARPSLIAKIRQADLVFCSGSGLEIGWLPLLLQKAKASVQLGRVGYIMAVNHVRVLEKPKYVDRSLGDIHPGGNPHVHTNPYNILKVAKALKERLRKIDPKNQIFYQKRYDNFAKRWQNSIRLWEKKARPLRKQAYITHHKSWVYLFDWLGLRLINTLEPKPGLPPTTSHLKKLLLLARKKTIQAILRTPYASNSPSQWLSQKSSIPILTLPYTIGGTKEATDLFRLFDQTIKLLLDSKNAK